MSHKYKAYTLKNFRDIPQVRHLSEERRFAVDVVGQVFPFKTNNYVVDELIDWDNVADDPMFIMNFPQSGMLKPPHFKTISGLLKKAAPAAETSAAVGKIRKQLNPKTEGSSKKIVPMIGGKRSSGILHKYPETVLFFPQQGQTCHSYCSFCFRWLQFVGEEKLKFSSRDIDVLIQYVASNENVTDILITGGDPMAMKAETLSYYIDRILAADLPNLNTIRIGTKSLSYWPYRYLTDSDADMTLKLFEKVVKSGRHLAFMAHISHPRELSTDSVKKAVARIRSTGAEIRTQAPLLRHINDRGDLWAGMWKEQVRLGMIPYYMFIVRDTGAQHFFGVPPAEALDIFRDAYRQVSGIVRTVRGPCMSAAPGKIQVLDAVELDGRKRLLLRVLQARDPELALKTFFAEYDEDAAWFDDLRPSFEGDKELFSILKGL